MEDEKKRDLAYTVIEQDEMPQELKEQIEKEEKNVFGITYADQGILYAARGFGEKKTDGYHAGVTACYETEDTIYVITELRFVTNCKCKVFGILGITQIKLMCGWINRNMNTIF